MLMEINEKWAGSGMGVIEYKTVLPAHII